MIVLTKDTKQVFKINQEQPEYGLPYVFSQEGDDWYYGETWPYRTSETEKNALELLNPTMIRRKILEEIDNFEIT